VVAVSEDGAGKVWNVRTGRDRDCWQIDYRVTRETVAFSAGAHRILSTDSSDPGLGTPQSPARVQLWEGGTGKLLGQFRCSRREAFCVALSPDGCRAAIGGNGRRQRGGSVVGARDRTRERWALRLRPCSRITFSRTARCWPSLTIPGVSQAIKDWPRSSCSKSRREASEHPHRHTGIVRNLAFAVDGKAWSRQRGWDREALGRGLGQGTAHPGDAKLRPRACRCGLAGRQHGCCRLDRRVGRGPGRQRVGRLDGKETRRVSAGRLRVRARLHSRRHDPGCGLPDHVIRLCRPQGLPSCVALPGHGPQETWGSPSPGQPDAGVVR
jgi:hypothetical protein